MDRKLFLSILYLMCINSAQTKLLIIRSKAINGNEEHSRTRRDLETPVNLVSSFYSEMANFEPTLSFNETEYKPLQTLTHYLENPDTEKRGRVTLQHTIPSDYVITDFSFHNDLPSRTKKTYHSSRSSANEELEQAIANDESVVIVSTTNTYDENGALGQDQSITAVIEIVASAALTLNITIAPHINSNSFQSDISIIVDSNNPSIKAMVLSPNYNKGHYSNNAHLSWLMSYDGSGGSQSHNNVLTTVMSMDTQACCDRLFVHDGPTSQNQILNVWSGSDLTGSTSQSSGENMLVQFVSDCLNNEGGFALEFSSKTLTYDEKYLTESHGTIFNPGYPKEYNKLSTFLWYVILEDGDYPIELSIVDVDISSFDSLTIVDLTTDETIPYSVEENGLLRYSITLNTNFMVNFTTVDTFYLYKRGFYFTYQPINPIETFSLTASSEWQNITYPNFSYENLGQIEWVITGSNDILFEIEYFQLAQGLEYVTIYNGESAEDILVHLTGTLEPNAFFISTQNTAKVVFDFDSSVTSSGFNILYKSLDSYYCNQAEEVQLGSDVVSIISPNFPSSYYNNNMCSWHFVADEGKCVEVSTRAYIKYYSDDYFTIHDGSSHVADILYKSSFKYAYSIVVSDIVTTSQNQAFVSFDSTQYYWFEVCQTNCSSTPMYHYNLTNPQGELFSPFYPNYYPKEINAKWYVTTDPAYYLYFDYLSGNLGNTDYLEFYEGVLEDPAYVVQNFSGSCFDVTINSNEALVTLRTVESSIYYNYFTFFYYSVASSCSLMKKLSNSNEGWVSSPNYPVANYPDNADCTVTVTVDVGNVVSYYYTYFNLESCCDYLTVYDGPTTNSTLIEQLSGYRYEYDEPRYSSSNVVTFKFTTDSSVTADGFNLFYIGKQVYTKPSISEICKSPAIVEAPLYGITYIFSNNFPNKYDNNLDMCWYVTFNRSIISRVRFDLDEISTESTYDYVHVYKESNPSEPYLEYTGKYTGSGNYVYENFFVHFHTDEDNNAQGFQIRLDGYST